MLQRLTNSLDTPLKRAGAVVLAIGLLWLFVGLGWIWNLGQNGAYYLEHLEFEKLLRKHPFVGTAAVVVLAGLMLSYAHDYTVGPVVKWVRGPSSAP